jgi:hypothetical protein
MNVQRAHPTVTLRGRHGMAKLRPRARQSLILLALAHTPRTSAPASGHRNNDGRSGSPRLEMAGLCSAFGSIARGDAMNAHEIKGLRGIVSGLVVLSGIESVGRGTVRSGPEVETWRAPGWTSEPAYGVEIRHRAPPASIRATPPVIGRVGEKRQSESPLTCHARFADLLRILGFFPNAGDVRLLMVGRARVSSRRFAGVLDVPRACRVLDASRRVPRASTVAPRDPAAFAGRVA